MPSRKGIPVPREQRNAATSARRPSMRDAAQAPWRSSLDLVWSYSRSQAFYGANIATSPSFADRHWAGPSQGFESSVDEEVTEEESDFDEETMTEDASIQSDEEANQDLTSSPAPPMQWPDEQLPANAIQRRNVSGRFDRSGNLGKREQRSKATNRRLSRLAADNSNDEERSRSRSRSPKRLNSSMGVSALRDVNAKPSDEGSAAQRQSKSVLQASQKRADETTPLLADSEAQQTRQHSLRTPSWFRQSQMSVASAKFQMQGYGTSTFWQSWFNTVNALIGVGILALPLAIAYAGLIPGVLLFLFCGAVTNYTGKVLAHIMAAEPSLRTYADIGNLAFGPKSRLIVTFFFCIELWAISTALIILFGDSARALVMSSIDKGGHFGFLDKMANWSPAAYKILGMLIVLPTMFLPLKFLSPISVVGIISVTTLFFVVLSDGTIKRHSPGSLWEPLGLQLDPQWSRLPLSFGLIMSGFSTHPIIPSLFKDMKNPAEFCKMLNWAYLAAIIIYLSMGLVGFLMFGRDISDEITRDIAHTKGYPEVLNKVAIWLIIINPLSKFALAASPISSTVELLLGVESSQVNRPPLKQASSSVKQRYSSMEAANNGIANGDPEMQVNPPQGLKSLHGTNEERNAGASSSSLSTGGATERGEAIPGSSPLAGSSISIRAAQRTATWSKRTKILARMSLQTTITLLIGLTAICLPGFEKVMAFLGAFLACVTCVFGPLLANLRLLHHEMSRFNIILDVFILLIFTVVATLGTIWSFLPLQ